MVRCIHFPFIVLLITWRKQGILGSDVNLNVEGTTCVGNNITLGCTIDPFTTIPSATWSRNGPTALTTCTSGGLCTNDDLTINSVTYYFSGNTTGIFASFQIQRIENEIEWICNHNATPYRYTFEVPETCPTVTTEMFSTSTSQDQITSSQNPSIVPSHNTEKTETTVMTTTDNDLTSSSLHVSSEVTTPIKTESDDRTDLRVSAIIAIAISGFIFLFLIIILIICCCQYNRKKSKGKTIQTAQEIHDDVVPKFGPNFNDHRFGNNGINASTAHVARGYNRYQGESDRGYNVRSKHQSDNYNRRRSNKEKITENRKHHPKQVQGKISHGFTQSIQNDTVNRYDINGMNTYALHDNYQNTRTHYREQAGSSPDRYKYRGSYLRHEYQNHGKRSFPYMIHLQEHVPRKLEGLIIYEGDNRDMNKQSRLYY